MLIGHVESWQTNYDFEKLAIDATTNYVSLTTMRMANFLKVEDKMLDNFEEELEDVITLIAQNNVPWVLCCSH